jgi:hypothetical protein
MSEKLCPETSPWGWKALIITCILSFIFMVIFYLAINNEPDYMPMNQKKQRQQLKCQNLQQMAKFNIVSISNTITKVFLSKMINPC